VIDRQRVPSAVRTKLAIRRRRHFTHVALRCARRITVGLHHAKSQIFTTALATGGGASACSVVAYRSHRRRRPAGSQRSASSRARPLPGRRSVLLRSVASADALGSAAAHATWAAAGRRAGLLLAATPARGRRAGCSRDRSPRRDPVDGSFACVAGGRASSPGFTTVGRNSTTHDGRRLESAHRRSASSGTHVVAAASIWARTRACLRVRVCVRCGRGSCCGQVRVRCAAAAARTERARASSSSSSIDHLACSHPVSLRSRPSINRYIFQDPGLKSRGMFSFELVHIMLAPTMSGN
jgi:hypothetical protein